MLNALRRRPPGPNTGLVAWSARFRNKRGDRDTYGLSVTHAYDWHRRCPCQGPRPASWVQVRGRGDQGTWAAAWLEWLVRSHLSPRGYTVVGRPSVRVVDVRLPVGDGATRTLLAAIRGGNLTGEEPPLPPVDMWDRNRPGSSPSN